MGLNSCITLTFILIRIFSMDFNLALTCIYLLRLNLNLTRIPYPDFNTDFCSHLSFVSKLRSLTLSLWVSLHFHFDKYKCIGFQVFYNSHLQSGFQIFDHLHNLSGFQNWNGSHIVYGFQFNSGLHFHFDQYMHIGFQESSNSYVFIGFQVIENSYIYHLVFKRHQIHILSPDFKN